jgi:uncharacterized protein with PQ loop repeat
MIHVILGWIGAFLFAFCAVPQVIKTYRTKKADDLSWLFLLFWLFGELLTLIYIVVDDIIHEIWHLPLYMNYTFNTVLVLYLIYAKVAYKQKVLDI